MLLSFFSDSNSLCLKNLNDCTQCTSDNCSFLNDCDIGLFTDPICLQNGDITLRSGEGHCDTDLDTTIEDDICPLHDLNYRYINKDTIWDNHSTTSCNEKKHIYTHENEQNQSKDGVYMHMYDYKLQFNHDDEKRIATNGAIFGWLPYQDISLAKIKAKNAIKSSKSNSIAHKILAKEHRMESSKSVKKDEILSKNKSSEILSKNTNAHDYETMGPHTTTLKPRKRLKYSSESRKKITGKFPKKHLNINLLLYLDRILLMAKGKLGYNPSTCIRYDPEGVSEIIKNHQKNWTSPIYDDKWMKLVTSHFKLYMESNNSAAVDIRLNNASSNKIIPSICGGVGVASSYMYIIDTCTALQKQSSIFDCVIPDIYQYMDRTISSLYYDATQCPYFIMNNCIYKEASVNGLKVSSCIANDIMTNGIGNKRYHSAKKDESKGDLIQDKIEEGSIIESLLLYKKNLYQRNNMYTGNKRNEEIKISGALDRHNSIVSKVKYDRQRRDHAGLKTLSLWTCSSPWLAKASEGESISGIGSAVFQSYRKDRCQSNTTCETCHATGTCQNCVWCNIRREVLLPLFINISDYWNASVMQGGDGPHMGDLLLSYVMKAYTDYFDRDNLLPESPIPEYAGKPFYGVPASHIFGDERYCDPDPPYLCGSAKFLLPDSIRDELLEVDCELSWYFAGYIDNIVSLRLPPKIRGSAQVPPRSITRDDMGFSFMNIVTKLLTEFTPGFCLPGAWTTPGVNTLCANSIPIAKLSKTKQEQDLTGGISGEVSDCSYNSAMLDIIVLYVSTIILQPAVEDDAGATSTYWILATVTPTVLTLIALSMVKLFSMCRHSNSLIFV